MKVAELLKWSVSMSGEKWVRLKQQMGRMREHQDGTLQIRGAFIVAVSACWCMEILRKEGLEVLCMANPIEVYGTQQPKKFVGKQQQSTKQGHEQVDEDEEKKSDQLKAEFEPLAKLTKEVHSDKVQQVAGSSCSVDPHVCLRLRSAADRRVWNAL